MCRDVFNILLGAVLGGVSTHPSQIFFFYVLNEVIALMKVKMEVC